MAEQQSKLCHETAKRYYDPQTKLEQFNKGDFVYVHDPTHKRSKVRKFSYQYKWPFEVKQKISPLIYKVCTADGTSAIMHISRLKRAYEQMKGESNKLKETAKLRDSKIDAPRDDDEIGTKKSDVEIPSHSLIRGVESNESDESYDNVISSSHRCVEDPEWTPGSSYLQRSCKIATQLMISHIGYILD